MHRKLVLEPALSSLFSLKINTAFCHLFSESPHFLKKLVNQAPAALAGEVKAEIPVVLAIFLTSLYLLPWLPLLSSILHKIFLSTYRAWPLFVLLQKLPQMPSGAKMVEVRPH